MSSVTFPSALGGDGATYTDDSNASTGLANGGHRTRFVPCLSGAVAMAESAADSAVLAQRRNVLINGSFEVWNDSISSTSCTAAARTAGPEMWYVNPAGAAVTRARSTTVHSDARARYSCELVGATSVTTVLFGTRLEAADTAKIKREVTFQAWVYNGSGASFQPSLLLGTPGAADNFTTVTNRLTQTLQSCPDATWTRVSHTADISAYTNLANGLQVELQIPSGSLVSGDTVRIMEPMLCAAGQVASFEVESVPETDVRCKRFFEKSFEPDTAPAQNAGVDASVAHGVAGRATTGQQYINISYKVPKRAIPTLTLYNPNAANAQVRDQSTGTDCTSSSALIAGTKSCIVVCNGSASTAIGSNLIVHWTANARLF